MSRHERIIRRRTDKVNGILLCRFHHLNLHNNHWRVVRVDDTYWLKPPPDIDPERKLIPLPSKSRAYREAMVEFRTKRGAAGTKSEREA